jgi:predicted transcriptional regulator
MDLKGERNRIGFSQWLLAKLSGVHQSRISLAENGLCALRQDEVEKLSRALNIDLRKIEGSRQ